MKLQKVEVSSFMGVASASLVASKPVLLVHGPNGAGKSSVYEAIRLALFDAIPRVDFKRDVGALIKEGAQRATISVERDGGDRHALTIAPSGRTIVGVEPRDDLALEYCTAPLSFLNSEDSERADIIGRLAGATVTAGYVSDKLTARGFGPDVVGQMAPLVVAGFEACVTRAREIAAEARGAWKAFTGETYGSVKAASWEPAAPGPLPEAPVGHEDAVAAHSKAVAERVALTARKITVEAWEKRRKVDSELATFIPSLQEKVAKLTPTAEAAVEPSVLECPACGTTLVMGEKDGAEWLERFVPIPRPTVSAAERAKAQRELAQVRASLRDAEAAEARLSEPGPEPVYELELTEAAEAEALAADMLRTLSAQRDAYNAAKALHDARAATAERALTEHRRVEMWSAVAEALGPTGIPAEIAAAAMTPFREVLRDIGTPDGWPAPEISPTGAVTAWGRPANLLSESEFYRVAVVLAVALARLDSRCFVMMDGADVLEPKARAQLLGWLCDLAVAGRLSQAWVFCTMKACFQPAADLPLQAVWMGEP